MSIYVELQVTSHFSFLRGASSPEELFAAAAVLGHFAMGLADWGTVAGVVRGWDGQKATGVRMIPGARIDLVHGRALLLYPRTRLAWSRLTRLLSIGKARGGKGKCILEWADVSAHAADLVGILVPDMADDITADHLRELREVFGARAFCALSLRRRPDDAVRLHGLDALARANGVRPVATGDVLYHSSERRPLQDVVSAIRERCTIDELGSGASGSWTVTSNRRRRWSAVLLHFLTPFKQAPTSPRNARSILARSSISIPTSR